MATVGDAATRLADGQAAADHIQRYVRAAHLLGYQHPDLTLHDRQVHQWYDGESGLDLSALGHDCAELRAAATATDEALGMQREQLATLQTVWSGTGADTAAGLLRRHCGAAAGVTAAIGAAAAACRTLHDDLWRLIDDKATATVDIDDRSCAQRPQWLAAAEAVTAGAGERTTAEELIETQVKPYVATDIAGDWLAGMRSASTAVAASYDTATERITAAPTPQFEIPGDLGPNGQALPVNPSAPFTAVAANPASGDGQHAWRGTASAPVNPEIATPQQTADIAASPASLLPAADDPTAASAPQLGPLGDAYERQAGFGTSTGTSGLGGLLGQVVDAIGNLLGSADHGLADPDVDELLAAGDPGETEPGVGTETDAADPGPDDARGETAQAAAGDEPEQQSDDHAPADGDGAAVDAGETITNTGEPDATPAGQAAGDADEANDAATPEGSPPPITQGVGAEAATPCEIAADELPQIGE